jgi:predicted  nucleic acid-binding Zn ribbon protein
MDRNGPMRRVCPSCARLMALVRRTRDLRDTCALFHFACEYCRVGYTEADDSERSAVRRPAA